MKLSSYCRRAQEEGNPKWHEGCVLGPDPWASGDPIGCDCSCHDKMRDRIRAAQSAGLSTAEIRALWENRGKC